VHLIQTSRNNLKRFVHQFLYGIFLYIRKSTTILLLLFGLATNHSTFAERIAATVVYPVSGVWYLTPDAACLAIAYSRWGTPSGVDGRETSPNNFSCYYTPENRSLSFSVIRNYACYGSASLDLASHTCIYPSNCTDTAGAGFVRRYDGACVQSVTAVPVTDRKKNKEITKSCNGLAVGDPVNAATGSNIESLITYNNDSVSNLIYKLNYLSNKVGDIGRPIFEHGQQWFGSFDTSLETSYVNNANIAPAYVYITRPDGQQITYTLSGSSYIADGDISNTITRQLDNAGNVVGWILTDAAKDTTETFSNVGLLDKLISRSGLKLAMLRDTQGKLTGVIDDLGRTIKFTYDSYTPKPRIITITQPDNGTIQLSYDSNNNLSTITWPDGKVRQYVYENSSLPHSLTGIIDENNNRFVTWTYDSTGRVTNETQALGANQIALSYNSASTDITDSLGTVRSIGITTILNQVYNAGSSQPAGSGCAASASAITYDVNGNISSRTDFNGNKTTYVYDLARNLETSRTEGLSSTGAVISGTTLTITTTWHATWHMPLQISEYSGGANSSGVPTSTTPFRQTTYTYDTKGNLTSLAISDPALGLTRTTTVSYTYSTIYPGLIVGKTVNGPRTDVSDITTYVYYPHTATCVASTSSSTATNLGCRGQLQSMTNVLGQITTYDRYNHHGQLEKMTDPNGLITTNTYDARQRLLTQTVGTLTTSLQYDGVGQVTKLTFPDSSYLNYTYDAAHRLTQIADGLNNTVTYTLDTEGNRISEQLKDPSGNLTKTLTRSYDALNRLQQLTGVGAQ